MGLPLWLKLVVLARKATLSPAASDAKASVTNSIFLALMAAAAGLRVKARTKGSSTGRVFHFSLVMAA